MKSELSLVGPRGVGPAGEAGEDIEGAGYPGAIPNARGQRGVTRQVQGTTSGFCGGWALVRRGM